MSHGTTLFTGTFGRQLGALATGLALLAGPRAQAQAPAWQWGLQTTNPTPADATGARGQAIATDAGGNAYVAGGLGTFDGSTALATRAFGSTSLSATQASSGFVAKASAAGQWLWAVRVSNDYETIVDQVITSPAGDVYVSGAVAGTTLALGTFTHTRAVATPGQFVARLDGNGHVQWVVSVANPYLARLAYDPSTGGVAVAGIYGTAATTFGTTTLAAAHGNGVALYVARLSAAGQWLSATGVFFDDGNLDVGAHLTVGPQGHVLVGGRGHSRAVVFGPTTLAGLNGSYLAQLSPAGQWQWAVATADNIYLRGLGYGPVGGVWACGYGRPGARLGNTTLAGNGGDVGFVAKVGSTGQWGAVATVGASAGTRRAGSALIDHVMVDGAGNALALCHLSVDYSGGNTAADFAIGGQTISLANERETRDVAVRLSPAGAWQYAVPTPAGSIANGTYLFAAALDATGAVVATGGLLGTLTLDTTALSGSYWRAGSSVYGGDALVARLVGAAVPLAVRPAAGFVPLAVWPNPAPAGAPATLRLPAPAATATPLTLHDARGRAVRTATVAAGQREAALPTAGLAPGLYLVRAGAARGQLVVE